MHQTTTYKFSTNLIADAMQSADLTSAEFSFRRSYCITVLAAHLCKKKELSQRKREPTGTRPQLRPISI